MKRIFIIIVISLFVCYIKAQSFNIGTRLGFGFYSLKDLKEFQLSYNSITGLPSKPVEKFPDFFQYSAECNYYLNNNNQIGINVLYHSTGGRNHLNDYSGEYKMDMILSTYRIGLHYKHLFYVYNVSNKQLRFYFQIEYGMMFSKLQLAESIIIYQNSSYSYKHNYKSNALFIEPALGFNIPLKQKLACDFNVGYEFDYAQKLYFVSDKSSWLTFWNKDVLLNFRGLRLRIGLFYDL